MNSDTDVNSRLDLGDLQAIADTIRKLADSCQADPVAILQLLRMLEALHREIREGLFAQSLPNNRQDLYSLLRDIEASGGWPYINRMKLRSLLINLMAEPGNHSDPENSHTCAPIEGFPVSGSPVNHH